MLPRKTIGLIMISIWKVNSYRQNIVWKAVILLATLQPLISNPACYGTWMIAGFMRNLNIGNHCIDSSLWGNRIYWYLVVGCQGQSGKSCIPSYEEKYYKPWYMVGFIQKAKFWTFINASFSTCRPINFSTNHIIYVLPSSERSHYQCKQQIPQ